MICSIKPTINIDSLESCSDLCVVDVYLSVAKVLDRLYGRKVAQKFFTSHFKSDSITLTV